jgi:hypothetical protein
MSRTSPHPARLLLALRATRRPSNRSLRPSNGRYARRSVGITIAAESKSVPKPCKKRRSVTVSSRPQERYLDTVEVLSLDFTSPYVCDDRSRRAHSPRESSSNGSTAFRRVTAIPARRIRPQPRPPRRNPQACYRFCCPCMCPLQCRRSLLATCTHRE